MGPLVKKGPRRQEKVKSKLNSVALQKVLNINILKIPVLALRPRF